LIGVPAAASRRDWDKRRDNPWLCLEISGIAGEPGQLANPYVVGANELWSAFETLPAAQSDAKRPSKA
jgi:hypothetical protein